MIRLATLDDTDTLCSLLKQLGYDADHPTIQRALMGQDSGSEIYVYELETEVIGFIATVRLFYFPELQHLTRITAICVDEQHRSSGIGSQLLDFVEDLATRRGDLAVEITCAMYRNRTHQFYAHRGYAKHSYKFIKGL